MTQSIKTRATLLTRLNAGTEILVAKLEDEERIRPVTQGPDADLLIPVIPGLYLFDLLFIIRSTTSPGNTNGIVYAFTGPLGLTDGGYGLFVQVGTPQRNTFRTGLNTVRTQLIGAASVNQNIYVNESGWFAVRDAGDLVLNWTSLIIGLDVTLQRGSSLHLVRASNDNDA